jgi:hypothetical protein
MLVLRPLPLQALQGGVMPRECRRGGCRTDPQRIPSTIYNKTCSGSSTPHKAADWSVETKPKWFAGYTNHKGLCSILQHCTRVCLTCPCHTTPLAMKNSTLSHDKTAMAVCCMQPGPDLKPQQHKRESVQNKPLITTARNTVTCDVLSWLLYSRSNGSQCPPVTLLRFEQLFSCS